MPNLEELRDAILLTVDDPSLDEDIVNSLINEGLRDVAARVLLPYLETSDTVSFTDESSIALPVDYDHGLFFAAAGGEKVHIATSMKLLTRRFPSSSFGLPGVNDKYVCARGAVLEIRPVLTSDVVIHYYGIPAPLAKDTDIPVSLPTNKQRRLLHSFACKELFSDIEDGMEGRTVNTDKFDRRYEIALVELDRQVKSGQSRPEPIRDVLTSQSL